MRNILLVVILVLLACAYPLVELNLKYEKRDLTDNILLAFPVAPHVLFVDNQADVQKAFGLGQEQDPVQAVADSLNAYLVAQTRDKVRKIRVSPKVIPATAICQPLHCSGYFSVDLTLTLQNIKYEFRIPKPGYVDSLAGETDFILVLDRVEISRFSQYQGHGPQESKGHDQLQSLVNFVLWDYNADRPVSYGNVQTLTPFAFNPTLDNWQAHFYDIIRNVYNQTPINCQGSL